MSLPLEIVCRVCGKDSLIRREPVFEGLRKTGERLLCASCGHCYSSESDVPFKIPKKSNIFSDEDKSIKVEVFRENEKGHTCRHCRHYLMNPFTQRCGMHFKEVQAIDSCADFEPKAPKST